MKTALITGCSGLVGTYLSKRCIERGYKVIGVDMKQSEYLPKDEKFTFKYSNLIEDGEIPALFSNEKIDVVFNCFGVKGSPLRAKNQPVDFLYPSFKINTEIINQCAMLNIWLVFVSSVGVYAPAEKFVEDTVWKTLPSEADWFPSWSKRMGEILLEAYSVQYNYKRWTIVRPANIFGEYDDFSGSGTIVSSIVKKVYEADEEIEAWGDGSAIRDFVFGDDVAEALLEFYEKEINDTVNFGSGIEISIRMIIEEIIKASEKPLKISWDSSKPNGDLRRQMDTKKQDTYSINPKTSISEAIKKVYDHYSRSNK
jgi:GDP-L-fucose synthase